MKNYAIIATLSLLIALALPPLLEKIKYIRRMAIDIVQAAFLTLGLYNLMLAIAFFVANFRI